MEHLNFPLAVFSDIWMQCVSDLNKSSCTTKVEIDNFLSEHFRMYHSSLSLIKILFREIDGNSDYVKPGFTRLRPLNIKVN